jgi:hypothetical protein
MQNGKSMTKAEQIRQFSAEGLSVSEIASRMGVRYQHAYQVLKRSETPRKPRVVKPSSVQKPPLLSQTLLNAGFHRASGWILDESGTLSLSDALPKEVGVYAFVKAGVVMYVGVATMGLAKRIYFYAKPGVSQRTSQRLNGIIRAELEFAAEIDVLVAHPSDMQWNGLPVHGAAGLELGLIKAYSLPWNLRSAG